MRIKEREDFNNLYELLDLLIENPYDTTIIEIENDNNLIEYMITIIRFMDIYEIESILNEKIIPKIILKYKDKEYNLNELLSKTEHGMLNYEYWR
jgi:hypothetical protein